MSGLCAPYAGARWPKSHSGGLAACRLKRVWSGFRSSAGPAGQALGVRATIRQGTGAFSSK
jgi:hypothetical protein